MALLADLTIAIKADKSHFDKGIAGSKSKVDAMKGAFKKNMGEIKIAAVAAGAAMVTAFAWATKESMMAEKSARMLKNALKNIGYESAEANKKLSDLANTLQKKTGFGDDSLRDAMGRLIMTTQDYNAALKGTEITADMAAATGMDLETSALLVGRAYNGNVTALTRYGIELKEGAKGMEVLEALEKRFAGASAARLGTLEGKVGALKNAWGDLGEALGDNVSPLFKGIVDYLKSAVEWWERLVKSMTAEKIANAGGPLEYAKQTDDAFKQLTIRLNEHEEARKKLSEDLGAAETRLSKARSAKDELETKLLLQEKRKAYQATSEAIFNIEQERHARIGELEKGLAGGADSPVAPTLETEGKDKGEKTPLNAFESHIVSVNAAVDQYNEKVAQSTHLTDGLTESFATLGQQIVKSEWDIAEAASAAGKTALIAILDYYGARLKANLALYTAELIGGDATKIAAIGATSAGIGTIEALKVVVTKMANGGVVTGPTPALIGEAGPEAVIPLEKLPQISRAINNNSNSSSINIVINSNGLDNADEIVRTKIVPAIERYNRRIGA